MTVTDWVLPIAAALSALAAWVALGFSVYNAYARRRDRKPRVEMVARWNLPRDVPQASQGPGFPATAPPGKAVFQCEITNVGMVGVKIREMYLWIQAPPGKPIPLHLPQGEQPSRLDIGDSQQWSAGPFDYGVIRSAATRTRVLALDSVGNRHEAVNTHQIP